MLDKNIISQEIERFVEGTDMFLVSLNITGNNVISIVIDSDSSVSLDDCVDLSRSIESKLNRDESDFELSVYTAGLSEPLTMLRQYKKHQGKEIEIVTKDGVKKTVVLIEADDEGIVVEHTKKVKVEGKKKKQIVKEQLKINYDTIATAKLVVKF